MTPTESQFPEQLTERSKEHNCFLSIRFPNEPRLGAPGGLLDGIRNEPTIPERFHLTLLVADQCSDDQLAMFLANLSPILPFSLEVTGLKILDGMDGQVLVWSVDPGPALARLQSDLYNAVVAEDMMISPYSKPADWVPHITIAYDLDNRLRENELPQTQPFRLMVNSFTIGRSYDDYFEVHLPRGVGDRMFVQQHVPMERNDKNLPDPVSFQEPVVEEETRYGIGTMISVSDLSKLVHGEQIVKGVLRRAVGIEDGPFTIDREFGVAPEFGKPAASDRGTTGSKQDGSKVGMKKQETGFNPDGSKKQFGMMHHQPVEIEIDPDLKELLEVAQEWDGGAKASIDGILLDSGTSEAGREGPAYDEEIHPQVVQWFDNPEAENPLSLLEISEMNDLEIQEYLDHEAEAAESNQAKEPKKNQAASDARGRARSYMFGRADDEIVAAAMATTVAPDDYRLGILADGAQDMADYELRKNQTPSFQPENYDDEDFETGFIYVDWLAVKTPGKGYGTQMLGEIFRQAAADERGVFLEASESTTEFYKRFRVNYTNDATVFWTAEEVKDWAERADEESIAIKEGEFEDEETPEPEEKSLVQREDIDEVAFGADDPQMLRPVDKEHDDEPIGGDFTLGNALWIDKPRPWGRQFASQVDEFAYMSDDDADVLDRQLPLDQQMPDERESMLRGVQRAMDNLVSRIFKKRHGRHEGQQGEEGRRGGSQAGFTHVPGSLPNQALGDEGYSQNEIDRGYDLYGNSILTPAEAARELADNLDSYTPDQISRLINVAGDELDEGYRDEIIGAEGDAGGGERTSISNIVDVLTPEQAQKAILNIGHELPSSELQVLRETAGPLLDDEFWAGWQEEHLSSDENKEAALEGLQSVLEDSRELTPEEQAEQDQRMDETFGPRGEDGVRQDPLDDEAQPTGAAALQEALGGSQADRDLHDPDRLRKALMVAYELGEGDPYDEGQRERILENLTYADIFADQRETFHETFAEGSDLTPEQVQAHFEAQFPPPGQEPDDRTGRIENPGMGYTQEELDRDYDIYGQAIPAGASVGDLRPTADAAAAAKEPVEPGGVDAQTPEEFARLTKVLNRVLGERMVVETNPENADVYAEVKDSMGTWQEGGDDIVDGFLNDVKSQTNIVSIYPGGDIDADDPREIDYDAYGELEYQYLDDVAADDVNRLAGAYDDAVEEYYVENDIDNWADLETSLMEDFGLTEQQVRGMGSQQLHNLVGSQAGLMVLEGEGYIEPGEYEDIEDVQLPSGGTIGGEFGDRFRSPGAEDRPPTQVSEMVNSALWDFTREMIQDQTTMADIESHFGYLPRIDDDTGDTVDVASAEVNVGGGTFDVAFSPNQYAFVGRDADGEISAVLSASVVRGHHRVNTSNLQMMIDDGRSRTLGLTDEQTLALKGETFVTLNYLAARQGGAGDGVEMILRGLKLAADNDAGILGNSVQEAAGFYDKLGARWFSENGPTAGGPAMFTPQDVKTLVTWLEKSGLSLDNITSEGAKEAEAVLTPEQAGQEELTAELVDVLASESLTMRFSPDDAAEALQNDPAAHFMKATRESIEKQILETNDEWVAKLDAARPVGDLLQKRHGDHEDQKGREGEKGGSQEGFTHTGAESSGDSKKKGGGKSGEDRMGELGEPTDAVSEGAGLKVDQGQGKAEILDHGYDLNSSYAWLRTNFTEVDKSLTPQDIENIAFYKENGYGDINRFLRGEKLLGGIGIDQQVETLDALDSEVAQEYVDGLDSIFQRSEVPEAVVAYRGMDIEDLGQIGRNFDDLEGEVFSFDGYTSTSLDKTMAQNFAGTREPGLDAEKDAEPPLLVRIEIPQGTKAIWPESSQIGEAARLGIAEEAELLLDRGLQFRVIETGRKGDLRTMTVQVVEGSGANQSGSVDFAEQQEAIAYMEEELAMLEGRQEPEEEDTSQKDDTSQNREDREVDEKRRDYWVWKEEEINLMDRRAVEAQKEAGDRQAEKFSKTPEEMEDDRPRSYMTWEKGDLNFAKVERMVVGPLRRVVIVRHGDHEGQEGEEGRRGGSQPGFTHVGAESSGESGSKNGTKGGTSSGTSGKSRGDYQRISEDGGESETSAFLDSSFRETLDNLDPDSVQALDNFKWITHQDINRYLRGDAMAEGQDVEEVEADIAILDAIMAEEGAALDGDVVLYRGMDLEDQFQQNVEDLVGQTVTFDGFTPTSAYFNPARAHSDEEGDEVPVVVEILAPEGTPSIHLNSEVLGKDGMGGPELGEVVLDRGMQFKIVETRTQKDDRFLDGEGLIITMEVVPGSSASQTGAEIAPGESTLPREAENRPHSTETDWDEAYGSDSAPATKVFRGHRVDAVADVLENGLTAGRPWLDRTESVYFTTSLQDAHDYGLQSTLKTAPGDSDAFAPGHQYAIVEFDVPDDADVIADELAGGIGADRYENWRLESSVPPDWIKAVHIYEIGKDEDNPVFVETITKSLAERQEEGSQPSTGFSFFLISPPEGEDEPEEPVERHGKHIGQEGEEGRRGGSAPGFTHEEGSVGSEDSSPTSGGGKAGVSTDRKPVKPTEFKRAFEVAMEGNEYAAYVTAHTMDELRAMKAIFLSEDGKAGFAIKDHGDGRIEATAAFNNGSSPGAFLAMLKEAVIKDGVNYVEAFGPFLPKYYAQAGFEVDTQSPWNPEYAPDNWNPDHGEPDYFTMKVSK